MKKSLIFGGSSGLGLEISRQFDIANSYIPIILSRNEKNDKSFSFKGVREYCDLSVFSKEQYINIFNKYYPIDSICFSQRYRNNQKKSENDFLEEYKVMVLVLKIMRHLIQLE